MRNILLVGILLSFFACDDVENPTVNSEKKVSGYGMPGEGNISEIILGKELILGNGYVHSWISLDKFDVPIEIGIEMTPQAIENLPEDSDFKKPFQIPLPEVAQLTTPFDHIGLNWSPENFSDIKGLDKAHFGIHFYMISEDERNEIPAWSLESEAQFTKYPPKFYMPVDYIPLEKQVGSVEKVGKHWMEANPFNESPFEHIMSLGTYNGQFIFISPLVSIDYLKSALKTNNSFSQPRYYPTNKLYPKEYNIYVNNKGNYCISLSNFITR